MHDRSWLSIIIFRRLILLMALLLSGVLLLAPAARATTPLSSAAEVEFPPFSVVDQMGEANGFSVELLRAALAAMGREVSFRLGKWSEVRGWLAEGQVQVLPLVGRTPEREEIFDFTFPYMSLHGAIVVRGDTVGISTLDDLRGKQVAVMRGDNAEEFLRREERGIGIVTTDTFETALNQLARGEHDAVVMQRLVALRLMQENRHQNLRIIEQAIEDFRQDFCFAVRAGDSETLALLNEGLALIMADGTYQRLHAKWFAALELPSNRPIIIGGDHNFPPYEYLDKSGQPAGYNVDLTRALARQMGLEIEIRLGSWAEMRHALDRGDIDALQGMFFSHQRNEVFDFTQPHLLMDGVAVVRREAGRPPATIAELIGKRIVVQGGDIMHDFALEKGLEDQLATVDSQELALMELARGRYDCALVLRRSAHHWISRHGWKNLEVGREPLASFDYAYAVQKGNSSLLAKLGEGLKVLDETGEYGEIYRQWMGVEATTEADLATIIRYVAMVTVPVVVLALWFYFWTWALRRRVAEKTVELREREEFIRTIMDNLPVGVAVNSVDPDVKFSYMNDNFPKLYGTTREALLTGDFWETVYEDPESREEIKKRVLADCASGDPRRMFWPEVPIVREGRETGYITASNVPLPSKELMISLVWEVSELVKAAREKEKLQRQLLQAQKMESVGRLAGGVAHDFNNMLSVIIGYAQMGLLEVKPGQPLHEELQEILMAGQRSAQITRQLLAFARQQVIAPRVLDLNATVGEMLKMMQRLIGEDISLQWRPAPQSLQVNMDPSQIDQILVNLCVNARDAIDGVGQITIETTGVSLDEEYCSRHQGFVPGDYVLLTISDDGCGMDQETLALVYEPFFSTKELGKGTGLGLATVYGIVKQNQGFINAYSEPGRGTTFRLYFPQYIERDEQEGPAVGARQKEAVKVPLGRGETVLVVEDDPALAKVTGRMLTDLGYAVLTANSAQEAFDLMAAGEHSVKVLLTDVVMPEMNGRELAEKIQQLQPDIKVVFMSGYTAEIIGRHGILDQGVIYLPKPFTFKDLAGKIREAL